MNCSTFRTHWVNYTDLSPESADLPRQCMLPEKPVLSIQMLEDRYALENHLLDAVNHGDADLAMQALQSFRGVTILGRKGHTKTTTVRFRAVALNALLRKEAERAEVHAFYLDTLYNDYLLAAGEITTEQQEQALVVEMLQQYCDRVARYSTAGYSVVIRNIIHYINLQGGPDPFHAGCPLQPEPLLSVRPAPPGSAQQPDRLCDPDPHPVCGEPAPVSSLHDHTGGTGGRYPGCSLPACSSAP